MGFLDKVKAQAEHVAKQGQDKIDDLQAKKKADGLLRDLGAWYYASQTARDDGQGPAELARIVADLQAHEAEHGPLGGDKDEPEPPTPGPDTAPVAVPGPPPTAPPGSGTPPPSPPPPPAGPPPAPLPPLGAPPMPEAPPVGLPPMTAGPDGTPA